MSGVETNDFLEKKEGYAVQLSNFEGPLDLLLYLIRKDEIDIYDIPIADITRQYLGYVELMQELDLEVAGEFILMAATLIQIKVRMLLPKPPMDEEEELEDPRAELVRQILEYKRFKEVAENMGEYESRQSRLFSRRDFQWVRQFQVKEEVSNEELLKDVSLFDLLSAFKQVIDAMPKVSTHNVGLIGTTIEEQIEMIRGILEEMERVSFIEVVSGLTDRVQVVVTFMAMLELIKQHVIRIQQASIFGEIWIMRRSAVSE
ncbi:segregation/condensation protein A [bacterium]|nr:segregation/condensation protein A [bacterium]